MTDHDAASVLDLERLERVLLAAALHTPWGMTEWYELREAIKEVQEARKDA